MRKIINNYAIGFFLTSLMVSCHGNDIFISPKQKTAYSTYEIRTLHIETSKDYYHIRCKKGHEGDKCIRLDSIPDYYLIERSNNPKAKNDSLAKRNNSYNILRPNESYTLSNSTIGDAAQNYIYFSTDSNAEIINVTTEEPLTDSPTE